MPLPPDPLLSQQWHLRNTAAGQFDLNVFGVWNPTQGLAYTGAGTRTVVIDDGFDFTHPDFTNYDQSRDFDFETNIANAFGKADQGHGTAVAGLIGAAANGTGAVGVAFGTSLIGYRTGALANDAWLQDVRDAIRAAALTAGADVANISQGISNNPKTMFGAGFNSVRFDEIETSIATAVNQGRGGLGMTIVKSAGNARQQFYDVNADDWTNDTRQVVVGAVDKNGFVSTYSSWGSALLVSAFGTPSQIVTTDRVGAAGYDPGNFTSTFNGTSAAAPQVAGVVALMYDANSALGWRDVQSILANSARHVGTPMGSIPGATSEVFLWQWNAADTWNGGGLHFSNDYGYGLVDARAAVRLAETWLLAGDVAQRTSNEFTNTMDVLNTPISIIYDSGGPGVFFSGNAQFDDVVDRVTVQVTFTINEIDDLDMWLTAPDGTVSDLVREPGSGAPGVGNGRDPFTGTWTFETQAFRGERAQGTWTLRVDMASPSLASDNLTISDIVIKTYGMRSVNDRYVFTNEYSDYDDVAGHLTAISDSNGGTDTVNAAAVTTASSIRLDGLASTIDGVGVTFANIENAIGGDGGDSIIGSNGNNRLWGLRGNDTLNGSAGNDSLDGGDGTDTLIGGLGNDSFVLANGTDAVNDGGGIDTITSTITRSLASYPAVENLSLLGAAAINGTGNSLTNTITGNGAANILNGGIGNDVLIGGLGKDMLSGGLNADRFDFNALADSVKGVNRDVVLDFNRAQGDKIDLSTIDADTDGTAGNQAFRFISIGAFTGVDGQLRCSAGIIQGDVNGDKVADFEIKVNLATMISADFIL